jgi:hypothetical protein
MVNAARAAAAIAHEPLSSVSQAAHEREREREGAGLRGRGAARLGPVDGEGPIDLPWTILA